MSHPDFVFSILPSDISDAAGDVSSMRNGSAGNMTGASPECTSIALRLLRLLQEEAMTAFPAFPEAFGQLKLQECSTLSSPLETDGCFLYYNPARLCRLFLESSDRLRCTYLHIHLHCLCLHTVLTGHTAPSEHTVSSGYTVPSGHTVSSEHTVPSGHTASSEYTVSFGHTTVSDPSPDSGNICPVSDRQEVQKKRLRDMACDLSATWLMAKLMENSSGLFCGSVCQIEICRFNECNLSSDQWMNPDLLLPLLADSESLRQFAAECALDTHCFWCTETVSASEMSARATADTDGASHSAVSGRYSHPPDPDLDARIRLWKTVQRKLTDAGFSGMGKRSLQSGIGSENPELQRRKSIDYHQFLYRFTVPREEMILDMDSFDYIPYHYGMTQDPVSSGPRPVFFEPLEYKEVNRLDELAIAIDTSGSCSGNIVRRFLEETWTILRQRENFFSRMRLHLIQCDSMIQEHRIFTSIEEWEAAIPKFRVLGQGNTDFRPVFDLLDALLQKKEIRHLRGLLYFSDGDGIFPRSRPCYDTAFVFLQEPEERLKIPDWVLRLNLNLPDGY